MTTDIAKKIRSLRTGMKLTQSQFSELVHMSENSIGKIERGVTTPTIDTLKKIADGLNIPLSGLLGGEEREIRSKNAVLDDLARYLKTKSQEDVSLIHKLAVLVLERKRK